MGSGASTPVHTGGRGGHSEPRASPIRQVISASPQHGNVVPPQRKEMRSPLQASSRTREDSTVRLVPPHPSDSRASSIPAIALRHLAALSRSESIATPASGGSVITLQDKVFGNVSSGHERSEDHTEHELHQRPVTSLVISTQLRPLADITTAVVADAKRCSIEQAWLPNKTERHSGCGEEAMTEQEAAKWLSGPCSSASCSPKNGRNPASGLHLIDATTETVEQRDAWTDSGRWNRPSSNNSNGVAEKASVQSSTGGTAAETKQGGEPYESQGVAAWPAPTDDGRSSHTPAGRSTAAQVLGTCSSRKPLRDSFSASLQAAMHTSLAVSGSSQALQAYGNDFPCDKKMSPSEARGFRVPRMLTIPKSTYDACSPVSCPGVASLYRNGTAGGEEEARRITPRLVMLDRNLHSALLNDEEWQQVSEDGDGTVEGSLHPLGAPPEQTALTLHTKLEQEASYSFTPTGALLLSGFQSPIPQFGLAAEALKMESIATASHSDTGGARSFTTLADIDKAATNERLGGGVITPMKERVVLLGRLGEGATGVVYRAFDLFDLRLVAVKVIPVNDSNKRRQLLHELSSLYEGLTARQRRASATTLASSSRNSPIAGEPRRSRNSSWTSGSYRIPDVFSDPLGGWQHLLELIDVFVTKSTSTLSLVVEYMDGGSLQDLVGSGGCQDEETLGHMALQALRGLSFLHASKKMHRDIKPANMLLNRMGALKIADFGLARTFERDEPSSLGRCRTAEQEGCQNPSNTAPVTPATESDATWPKEDDRGREQPTRRPPKESVDGGVEADRMEPRQSADVEDAGLLKDKDVMEGVKSGIPREVPEKQRNSLHRAHSFVGTVTYMSPERINGDGYSYSADVWSLGMTILTTALGKLPIETKHGYWGVLHSIRDADAPTLPKDGSWSPEFREFISLCLEKDPARRLDCTALAKTAFLRRAAVTWDSCGNSCNQLLEGDMKDVKLAELKSTLAVIEKHVKSLIKAADSRAEAGDSPTPTERGGLGVVSTTEPVLTKSSGSQSNGPPTTNEAPQYGGTMVGGGGRESPRREAVSTVTTIAGAGAEAAVDRSSTGGHGRTEVPARTRVLRRVSSIQKLFLGATRGGERLKHFAEQMGLPHDVIVTHFQDFVDWMEAEALTSLSTAAEEEEFSGEPLDP